MEFFTGENALAALVSGLVTLLGLHWTRKWREKESETGGFAALSKAEADFRRDIMERQSILDRKYAECEVLHEQCRKREFELRNRVDRLEREIRQGSLFERGSGA